MIGTSITTDIAIIGTGPTGLFAAFECSMLKMKSILIDTLDTVGGQCSALYPEKPIYDIPAHPSITAQSLIDSLEKQIEPFDIPRLLSNKVIEMEGQKGNFTLKTDKNNIIHAKGIIIAIGAGSFGPNRPPLENIEAYEQAKTVHYYIRKSDLFIDKNIVIAGGGDSAVDWALTLKDKAKSITLIHRRDRFRASPESLARLETAISEKKINKLVPYQLHKLHGKQGFLESVDVISLDKQIRSLPADHLLAFFGLTTDLGPLQSWDIDIIQGRIPVTPSTCETSLEGTFAIGDIAFYPGKLKLILQGFSEASMAAYALYNIVNPETPLHFEHSTTHGIPVKP